ncbi:GGDEF domain-containing protein [uncultured Sphingomonas sp.]|uniref:GGDEF domain-containing protein n=1 Tax=uncultured Sphingomonas sp. TaxID=158754 RepID=UPI002600CF32|nr:GGDEF domain-containing protein [uncultured Sphingomonas sp.]
MVARGAVAQTGARGAAAELYDQIGQFLTAQRLSPDPVNYVFAHNVLSQPGSPLAKAVASLTDGGIRLTVKDIEELGVETTAGSAAETMMEAKAEAARMVARTQMQLEGFVDLASDLQVDTADFGRDLAASAEAIRTTLDTEEVVRLTAALAERVQAAEARLEATTREAAHLRAELEEARDNARRDPLTDLPNRRAFEETFAERMALGQGLWLAVCDIDHFKSVNDRFGHAVGDRVLKAIGTAVAEQCDGQFVARYGGEEFIVLFSNLNADQVYEIMNRAREHVADKRYKLRETDAPLGAVTLSAGITEATCGDTARMVFQRADRLLYLAKSDGRNCVRIG